MLIPAGSLLAFDLTGERFEGTGWTTASANSPANSSTLAISIAWRGRCHE